MTHLERFFCLAVLVSLLVIPSAGKGQDKSAAKKTTATFKTIKNGPPLAGTKPLKMEGDIAAQLVAGVDKFLLRKIEQSVAKRKRHWKRDFSSAAAYNKSIEPNRKRLRHILGMRDKRAPFDALELVSTTSQPALLAESSTFKIYAIRWPAVAYPDGKTHAAASIYGEGLLLVPTQGKPIADIVAIPDCDQTPEQICGLVEGVAEESQFARRLAESGCRVIVPVLVNRQRQQRGGANLTNREYLYRSAFALGRHLIGYEVQKVLAAVDWFEKDAKKEKREAKIGVIGYGEGGMIALYAGALDMRIDATCVSGYFKNRNDIWQQPLDRNVFGLLEQFGDAELSAMIAPRTFVSDMAQGPEIRLSGQGGAPATLNLTTPYAAGIEVQRERKLVAPLKKATKFKHTSVLSAKTDAAIFEKNRIPFGTSIATGALLEGLGLRPKHEKAPIEKTAHILPDAKQRQARQIAEIDRHNQLVLRESASVRRQFMSKLDTSSLAAYEKSVEPYREHFATQVIGRFDDKRLPFSPRTRKTYESKKWTGYEVVLDVFPDVIAYGILLVPKDLKPGERRPVVVCQHGLEGRPQSVIGEKDYHYYKAFAAKLADRGFITFAPQNLYIGGDKFRTLQRKANPLGKTLFSIIVPQHRQIVDWLKTQPFVDSKRIAFYGLSYGGKSAMRIPPLVKDYCLSICSADFNEWVDKNASTLNPRSYIWTGEYEIFEFDLGSTFNYAEMAALIAPRPFMVERGHFDGVGDDWTVAWEYAKIRHLYAAKLGIPERTEIEWFVGPHSINEQGTYRFLHNHLKWPEPKKRNGK